MFLQFERSEIPNSLRDGSLQLAVGGKSDRKTIFAIHVKFPISKNSMSQLPKIFIAYAREDASYLERFRKPLNVLRRNGHCRIFFDGEIIPGERWDDRLKAELHQADIFVLLVTDDFLDSDYINDVELPKALEKEKAGKAKVVPIILRPCMWEYTLLSQFQVVLHEGQPIETSGGYVYAVEQIARVIKQLKETLHPTKKDAEDRIEVQQKVTTEHQRLSTIDPFHDLMIPIKGGTFQMGDEHGDLSKFCRPVHEVRVKDFQLCKHPVTQAQWRDIMGEDPPILRFKGCDNCPLERVSWNDVKVFIKRLNEKTNGNYRLPSEAEWEFAARGGNQTKKFKFAGSDQVKEVAWFDKNSGKKTQPVMQLKPNELGLYDLSGNIWEWCEDNWHDNYNGAPKDGSAWTIGEDQLRRVVRGGSWFSSVSYCRVSYRNEFTSDSRVDIIGFRLAR